MARTSARERFIEEFLVDRDARAAGLRAGVAKVVLKKTVSAWMRDPAVLAEIDLRTDALDPTKMIQPQRVIAGFQDIVASRFASHSAKNAALRELAKLARMYPEDNKKPGADDERKRPAVMLMPADVPQENWEQSAMESQKRLKQDVRE